MRRILLTLTCGFGLFFPLASQANPEDLSLDQLDLLEESILEPKTRPLFESQLFELDLPPRWALVQRSDRQFLFKPTDGRDARC